MKKLRALRIFGAVLAALGIAGVCVSFLSPSSLIISIGIRAISAIKNVSLVLIGAGAAAVAGGFVPAVSDKIKIGNSKRLLESDRQNYQKNFDEYAKDSLNPARTRERLEQLRRNNYHLGNLVNACLSQMDRMDTFQARHKSLLDANDAIYLEDTIEVLNESERRMCRNFRNIINCCILIEDTDQGTEALDRGIIDASFADNEEELNAVATLLKYSVAYINNYNRNGVSDRAELDAWLKIMETSTGGKNEGF